MANKKYSIAQGIYGAVLGRSTKIYGKEHPKTYYVYGNLGYSLLLQVYNKRQLTYSEKISHYGVPIIDSSSEPYTGPNKQDIDSLFKMYSFKERDQLDEEEIYQLTLKMRTNLNEETCKVAFTTIGIKMVKVAFKKLKAGPNGIKSDDPRYKKFDGIINEHEKKIVTL